MSLSNVVSVPSATLTILKSGTDPPSDILFLFQKILFIFFEESDRETEQRRRRRLRDVLGERECV